MRSLSVRLLLSLFVVLITVPMLAHDVTLSGTNSFASLDGSSSDHDGAANGVFTVNDGNLVVNGIVNCNDDTGAGDSACSMAFAVSGNMSVNTVGALYAENRSGSGTGGAITLSVGGNLALNGNAIVSTASRSSSGATGGAITANVTGSVSVGAGSTIDSGSANARGGAIVLASSAIVTVDGNVLSGPSRTLLATRLSGGAALDGGSANSIGGAITIGSSTFVEPAIVIGSTANIVSQGGDSGAGPITLDGCGVTVRGLVAALSRKDGVASVAIRSGKDVVIDGRDLGGSGTRMGRIRADAPTGTALRKGVDIFAAETIDLFGAPVTGSLYLITSLPGLHDAKSYGGTIRITSLGDTVNGSGKLIDDGHSATGDTGGSVEIAAKGDVNLATAAIRAHGDFNTNNSNRGGGSIAVRSHSGDIIWTNGLGEVRPVGSTSGLTSADQGRILLTACGTINTTGTSFPVEGVATSPLPETHTGVCSPAAPVLPIGVPPLVTCNTPPVANDASASTNEDTTVTITLTGSDADGDSLTFTIVSGPANGSLGTVISTGPTSATVDYTPNLNYNGGDSFVFRANDGNGGTDDATATITIAPVNDPPSFLAGPSVTSLEDSGAQTYANWATSISAGPADESAQIVTFTVTNSNNALFAVQPALSANGTLTFTAAANAYGSATVTIVAKDNGGTANGGNDTSAPQSSIINVTGVNDEPSFAAGANQNVGEDAGLQSVSGWATAIAAGPNESGQTVSFVVANNSNALFSAQPAVASNGTLTYTPAANANGVATVSVYAQDDGGTANGGDDTSAAQTFTITVNAVNDQPSFTSGGDVTVLEDSPAYSAPWATAVSAGPSDENGQTVSFTTSNSNNALFASQPAIAANGTLAFTVAANAFGSATVTVSLADNGGTANGGDDTSSSQTFTITVDAVNDEPSFTSGGGIAVLEDSGAYSASWVAASSAGPGESQALTYFTSNNNNSLFSVQPSVAPDGTLSFTPAANANGSATVAIYVKDDGGTASGGDDTSGTQTFTIEVTAVNDTPSFTSGGNVNVNEDSGAYSAPWATAISAGPADESGQTLTFNITGNTNPSLFAVPPSIAADGTLSFTLLANAFGTATITVTLSDDGGGANASAPQSFDIVVSNINDAPTFAPGGDVTRNEDSGAYSAAWASSISAGPSESAQTLTFVVSNDNNALFASQPAISASGVLTFNPAANAFGTANVTVYLQDNGGTANGGSDTSGTVTFQIVINSVNDAPSFTSGGDVTVAEDTGAYSASWATAISGGPSNESPAVSFVVTGNTNPSMFAVAPAVAPNGELSFTLNANATGSSTITLHARDDGGTANGGVDVSPSISFTINVNDVNDPPTFTAGGDVTVNEDSGTYSATWATSISSGPGESGQVVTFFTSNDNTTLFSGQPSISAAGVLTFTPAPNAFGTATVSVYAKDNGGTANGGNDTSAMVTFVITVNGVNEPPVAGNDTWETLGNTELRVDLGAGTTPAVGDTTPSGTGVLHNDTDAEGDPFAISGVVGCADTTAPYVCAVTGGTVTLNGNGTFSFHPSPGATSASFQYTVTDQPPAGIAASANATVSLTIHDMIWYVNGAAAPGGNGTSASPFNNFNPLNSSSDVDGSGAYIFVHTSAVNDSIALEPQQKLWGAGVGLIIPRNLNGNGSPATIVAPGVRPTIVAVGDAISVIGASSVEIAGLSISSGLGKGIRLSSPAFGGTASASIYSNAITSAAQQGIVVDSFGNGTTTAAINGTDVVSTGNGIDVSGGDGTVVFSFTNGSIASSNGTALRADGSALDTLIVNGLSNVTVSGNTAGDGISITAARFDANAATPAFEPVNGGTIAIGAAGNPVGGAAITLANASGDLAFGSLTAHGATTGVTIAGTGLYTGSAGTRVTSGGGAVSAAAGAGLTVTNTTIGSANLAFTSISATGGANGILINNTGTVGGLKVLGTGTAGSGGTIHTAQVGVRLVDTTAAALSYMNLHDFTDFAIRGTTVNGFALSNSTINGTNGDNAAADEGTVTFRELTGSASISGSSIGGGVKNNLTVINTTGTLNRLTISSTTFGAMATTTGDDGVLIEGRLNAVVNATVENSFFNSARGDHFQLNLIDKATSDLVFTGNTVTNNHPAVVSGGGGVRLTGGGTGSSVTATYNFSGNSIRHSLGTALAVTKGAGGGSFSGSIANNTIGVATIADSGSVQGSGISVTHAEGGVSTVSITNNGVRQYGNFGIFLQTGGSAVAGSGTLKATVTGNAVSNPGTLSFVKNGFHLNAGTLPADTYQVCLTLGGAGALANSLTGSGAGGGTDFRLRQRQATTVRLPGYAGANNDNAAVVSFVQSNNGGTPTGTVANTVPTGGGYVGGICP